jgi:hypothetical protein
MNYGEVALGVESAMPFALQRAAHSDRARRLFGWLIAAFKRSA